MLALVNFSDQPGSVELRDLPVPKPGAGQVLVRVGAVGVCGSDLHMWKGPVSWSMQYPVVLGHEFAGTIEDVGSGVRDWQVGDRVTCETAAQICGVCAYCRTGNYNLCPERQGFGAVKDGAMAEFVAVREGILHHIPDDLSFQEAALTEPAAVSFNAAFVKSRPLPGDVAVVIGPGPIGLMALQMLNLSSPSHAAVVGLSQDKDRLELARSLHADSVIFADREDPVTVVRSLGDGFGAALVIDAVGIQKTLQQSVAMVRPNGQITKIGWDPKPVGFSFDPIVAKAAAVQGTFSHTWDTWERVIVLLSQKKIDAQAMSESFELSDWEMGFKRMDSLKIAKAVLVPSASA